MPPAIDGRIHDDEWREAVRVMGVVAPFRSITATVPSASGSAWDAKHLYLAARSDVLPGHRLYRSTAREVSPAAWSSTTPTSSASSCTTATSCPASQSSFLKFILNSLGSGEYMKLYPSIGQNMYNWQPGAEDRQPRLRADGRQWWDMEMAMDLEDLQCRWSQQGGRQGGHPARRRPEEPRVAMARLSLGLRATCEHYGFPRTVLTRDEPYVQIERSPACTTRSWTCVRRSYNPGRASR